MIVGSLARRYAKAILSVGIEHRNYEKLSAELDKLVQLYQDHQELRSVLENAIFPIAQRRGMLTTVMAKLGVSKAIEHLVLLLLERGKISYLPSIAKELRVLVDKQAGRIRGKITSVIPLDLSTELRFQTALERTTGRKVVLEKVQDPSLIGGFVLQLGDVVYDGSVTAQLNQLRKQLSFDISLSSE